MKNNEVEQIIKRNLNLEKNMINQEKDNLEKNIITQNKKINPFIEIIDSSRLNDNIIDISQNSEKPYNNEEKKEINSDRKNNLIEEPMTFNPNRKNNKLNNSIKTNKNSNTNSNKAFVTFKNEQNDIEEEINESQSFNNNYINNCNYLNNYDGDIIIINNIIEILKISINKIQNYINNTTINNDNDSLLIKKFKDIKNNINEIFDKIIEVKSNRNILNKNINDDENLNNSNNNNSNIQSPFKITEKSIFKIPNDNMNNNFYETDENFFSSFLGNKNINNSYNNSTNIYNSNKNNDNLIKKISEIEETENIFKNQIINLKKEIYLFRQENNDLKQIIQNLKKLMDELMDKNKLLSSKLIKYKTLYEEK